ncbi:hypothetical protein [Micromonospora cremea]|uniref:Uncharacterized protein n=1 Tax=Micromonospora cremea TaxID=709881 RepID=A0A1N5UZW4_9ACTN|nr:hypothetical protein [Micromonospora cremea]SIM66160.1 hypothetical protein SAMN04489832_1266 [Micromonospora cremea]
MGAVTAARAYLQVGDLRGAARALVDAHSVAPAEVQCGTRRGPDWRPAPDEPGYETLNGQVVLGSRVSPV